jgi:hypothetical protein
VLARTQGVPDERYSGALVHAKTALFNSPWPLFQDGSDNGHHQAHIVHTIVRGRVG